MYQFKKYRVRFYAKLFVLCGVAGMTGFSSCRENKNTSQVSVDGQKPDGSTKPDSVAPKAPLDEQAPVNKYGAPVNFY